MRIIDVLRAFPDKPWNYERLSEHLDISFADMIATKDMPWNWKTLSLYLYKYTLEDVLAHTDIAWDWICVSRHPDVTMDVVQQRPELPWSFDGLSANPNIRAAYIRANTQYSWSYAMLSQNRNLTEADVRMEPDRDWDWDALSWHPLLTIDLLLAFPEKPWNWGDVSGHENIRLQHILAHSELPWVWPRVRATLEDVLRYPTLPWKHSAPAFENVYKHVTIRDVLENPAVRWCWVQLSVDLPIEDILANPGCPWDVYYVNMRCDNLIPHDAPTMDYDILSSRAPDIGHIRSTLHENWNWSKLSRSMPFSVIFENLDLPWEMCDLSNREDLCIQHVASHPSLDWYWSSVSMRMKLTASELFEHIELPWMYECIYHSLNLMNDPEPEGSRT
jgi:hypothetical protein